MTNEKYFLKALLEETEIVCKPEDRQQRTEDAMSIVHTMIVSRLEELNQNK